MDLDVFDMYFTAIASIQFHPVQMQKGETVMTLRECAEKAVEMMQVKEKMKKEGKLCL